MLKKIFMASLLVIGTWTGSLFVAGLEKVFARGDSIAYDFVEKLEEFGSTTAATGLDFVPLYDASAKKDKKMVATRFLGLGAVQLAPDVTTFNVGTGTVFKTGSNTTATAITDVEGGHAGQIFTIVTTGGTNFSTIAEGGNFNLVGGPWTPDSADDNISFLILGDNDYVQIFGTATNN